MKPSTAIILRPPEPRIIQPQLPKLSKNAAIVAGGILGLGVEKVLAPRLAQKLGEGSLSIGLGILGHLIASQAGLDPEEAEVVRAMSGGAFAAGIATKVAAELAKEEPLVTEAKKAMGIIPEDEGDDGT